MTNNHQNFGQWIQQLAARSMAEQVRAVQRYNELVQRYGRGELFTQAVAEEYLRFAQGETTQYARDVAMLSLNYYNALADLGQSYADHFFEQVLGTRPAGATGTARAAAESAATRRVAIHLQAPLGEIATQSFVLENKRAEGAEIAFLVSDFVGPAGTAPFRPTVEFEPARFSLAPREERPVTLQLVLAPELFAAGEHYTATVVVGGYDDLELGLDVAVDPAAGSDVSGTS